MTMTKVNDTLQNTGPVVTEIRELTDREVQVIAGAMPSLKDIGDWASAPGRAVASAGRRYADWVSGLF
jgi:hypothetical protein